MKRLHSNTVITYEDHKIQYVENCLNSSREQFFLLFLYNIVTFSKATHRIPVLRYCVFLHKITNALRFCTSTKLVSNTMLSFITVYSNLIWEYDKTYYHL